MRKGRSSLLVVVAVFLQGCPSDSAKDVVASPQGGTAAVAAAWTTLGAVEYHGASNKTEIWANGPNASAKIQLTNLYPHAFVDPDPEAADADEIWVIGRVGLATVIRSYRDTNGDDIVEAATGTDLIAASAHPSVVDSAAFDPDSGALYMLEQGTGDVYRATDTNADLRPDVLSQTPFVRGTWTPAEPGPVWLDYADPDTGIVTQIPGGVSALATCVIAPTGNSVQLVATLSIELARVTDTNGDGVVDTATVESATAVAVPEINHIPPVANLSRLSIGGSEGATVQIQKVDAAGGVLAVLASGTVSNKHLAVTLPAGLIAGELVRAYDVTNSLAGEAHEVLPAAIYLYPPGEPILVDVEEAETLVLEGVNLNRVTEVSLRHVIGGTEPALDLDFSVAADGKSITVEIPALGDAWEGHAVVFCGNGDVGGGESEYGIVAVAACKAETAGSGGG